MGQLVRPTSQGLTRLLEAIQGLRDPNSLRGGKGPADEAEEVVV